MGETLANSKEQRNNFAFDEEKEKTSFWVKQGRISTYVLRFKISVTKFQFQRPSSNDWISSPVQIKFISGDSFKYNFYFGYISYQMCLTNVFLCVYITYL